MKPSRGSNDYRTQRYTDADALYAFKSRGFGREIGVSEFVKIDSSFLRS